MKNDVKAALFNFIKPSRTATIMSSHLAFFVSETLNIPLLYNDDIADTPLDVLMIQEGPYAFCSHLPALAKAIRDAKRVLWIQIDYTLIPPKISEKAQSPFRKAWRLRRKDGKPHMDLWTTVEDRANDTPLSRYVNWNSMTYQPLDAAFRTRLRRKAERDLFYYGAYRKGRIEYFHRYFDECPVPVTISGAKKEWKENWPHVNVTPAMVRGNNSEDMYANLASHGLGLYLGDKRSHKEFHSPPNRFYEMLAAGLPMVFQPEAIPAMEHYGFACGDYAIEKPSDIVRMMSHREDVGTQQRKMWDKPYHDLLKRQVRKLWKEYTWEI